MNSKNKYRAWDKEEKKMCYNAQNTYDWGCYNGGCPTTCFGEVLDDENYITMQYTGYNDKNNREVYEEDFIPYHFNESKIGIVKYGLYSNCFDKTDCEHIGFYVDWQGENEKNTFRKDLGYWLKVSEMAGNAFEGLYNKNNKINEVK